MRPTWSSILRNDVDLFQAAFRDLSQFFDCKESSQHTQLNVSRTSGCSPYVRTKPNLCESDVRGRTYEWRLLFGSSWSNMRLDLPWRDPADREGQCFIPAIAVMEESLEHQQNHSWVLWYLCRMTLNAHLCTHAWSWGPSSCSKVQILACLGFGGVRVAEIALAHTDRGHGGNHRQDRR